MHSKMSYSLTDETKRVQSEHGLRAMILLMAPGMTQNYFLRKRSLRYKMMLCDWKPLKT